MKLKIDPQEEPVDIDKSNWLYFEPKKRSITLIHQVRNKIGEYIKTDQINIPLRLLEPHLKIRTNKKV